MSEWKLWYHDRTTYAVADGAAVDAPNYGVICITQKIIDPVDNVEKHVRIAGPDFYRWEDPEWVGVDFDGIVNMLILGEQVIGLKAGRWIPRRAYLEILKDADADR
jgi:GH15 family glucan-1,4-alpha-glucosidase